MSSIFRYFLSVKLLDAVHNMGYLFFRKKWMHGKRDDFSTYFFRHRERYCRFSILEERGLHMHGYRVM